MVDLFSNLFKNGKTNCRNFAKNCKLIKGIAAFLKRKSKHSVLNDLHSNKLCLMIQANN